VTLFIADDPINAIISIVPLGRFEIHGPQRGTALPAGTPFEVPDGMADAFEAQFGPQPGNTNVSPEARQRGRIAGLRRYEPDVE
jgi:hypothetical protein